MTPTRWTMFGLVAVWLQATALGQIVEIETVLVGDPGNTGDTNRFLGGVAYPYEIAKYEVTLGQYTAFLNAVATNAFPTSLASLWNPAMATDLNVAGITRSGSGSPSNPYRYQTIGDSNRPVTYVSWYDAARFANWLHNGATNGSSTEIGSYALNGRTNGSGVAKSSQATWWIPSESEWYKAAYYKGGGRSAGYWTYPTRSDTPPGNLMGSGTNMANYFTSLFSTTQSSAYSNGVNYLTPVGVFDGSPGPYGTFDQAGNVLEWVGDSAFSARGGHWASMAQSPASSITTTVTDEVSVVGFRLARPVGPRLKPDGISLFRYNRPVAEVSWNPPVEGDPGVSHVVDVEFRSSLDSGSWKTVGVSNFTGYFNHSTNAAQGFYRLRSSALPFALVGPAVESTTQGVRLDAVTSGDVLFFAPALVENGTRNSMAIWVDGVFRGEVEFTPSREGTTFQYQVAGTEYRPLVTFSPVIARLDSPAFQAATFASSNAQDLVVDLVRRYPDSVTTWQNIGGTESNEATVLHVRADAANTNQGARPSQFGAEVAYLGHPLISGADLAPIAQISNRFPFSAGNPLLINLNETNTTRPVPWIGFRTAVSPSSPVMAARWIYIGSNGQPTNATNPATMRYAFWVEDESFKVNLNTATNGLRGSNSLASGPEEIRIDGSWGTSTNPLVSSANVQALILNRTAQPGGVYSNVEEAAAVAGITDPQAVAEVRFLSAVHSGGHELTRSGARRFNINSITNAWGTLRFMMAITNSNAVPLFGQRFYRLANNLSGINATNAVTTQHASVYLQKLAANVQDYVDADDQPTIVNNDADFSLRTGRPSWGIEPLGGGVSGSNSVAAQGVENLPRLQEYAIHVRVRSLRSDPANPDSFGYNSLASPFPPQAAYEVWIDHYFEFWNPGTRDITLTNAFLKLVDQPAWGTSVTGPLAMERDSSEIPLDGVTFPAGRVTVLTTAPPNAVNSGDAAAGLALIASANTSNVVSLPTPDADRIFTGTTADIKQITYNSGVSGPALNYNRLFDLSMRTRTTSTIDSQSAVLIGNDAGILESFTGLIVAGPFSLCVSNSFLRDSLTSIGLGNNDNLRVSALRGNLSVTMTPTGFEGDPRTLNEQLEFLNYTTPGTAENTNSTRFFSSDATPLPGGNTMGAPNTNYVNAARWLDVSSLQPGASNAPMVVRNGPMEGIGELGHITDPARPYYTSGTIPVFARGGGRTLRVGQSEFSSASGSAIAWYTGTNQTNASRTWTSWRLTDIFSAGPASTNTVRGRINPNGALRDNGAALQAALFGLTFQPSPAGAPQTAGRPVVASNVVTAVLARLTNGTAAGLGLGALNPFWERGEISELSVFNAPTVSTLVPGIIMSNVFDRGREELVRRSLEMMTTRGSIFTVYAIGQSIQMTNSSTNVVVLDTRRMKRTFEILPQFQYPTDSTNDAFYPRDSVQTSRRFMAPTNYETRVISTSVE